MKLLHSPKELYRLYKIEVVSNSILKELTFTYSLRCTEDTVANMLNTISSTAAELRDIVDKELYKYKDYLGKECLVPIGKTNKVEGGYITEYVYIPGIICSKPRLRNDGLYASVKYINDSGLRADIDINLNVLKEA